MNKRQVWVEPLFAEAKDWHGMRRFRLRRRWRVNGEAYICKYPTLFCLLRNLKETFGCLLVCILLSTVGTDELGNLFDHQRHAVVFKDRCPCSLLQLSL